MEDLDRKILRHLSVGASSYEELARICQVNRNTIYRRIAALERKGIIKNSLRCSINLGQLEITPIIIQVNLPQYDLDEALLALSAHRSVRLLWRTYGDFNVSVVAFSDKGKEGAVIGSLKALLEGFKVVNIAVSVGFDWVKTDFETLDTEVGVEEGLKGILARRG